MHLKMYIEALDNCIALRVLFLDPRFKYMEGVMRTFQTKVGIKIMSSETTDYLEAFEENEQPVLLLGYADEEPAVIKAANLKGSPEYVKGNILLALYEWNINCPHLNDLITTERNNIYEF